MAEFIFQLSSYNDPALEEETAQLLAQRLEERSREAAPGIWAATDKLNAYAAKGTGREKRRTRHRIYGVILIALGVFILVPGLAEPGTPALIGAGAVGIVAGILECYLTRKKQAPALPAVCRKEAARLLEPRRSMDGSFPESRAEVRFDGGGLSLCVGGETRTAAYGEMTGIFASECLWLLLYGDEQALLLQKKDLVVGDAAEFELYLRRNITQQSREVK